MTERILLPLDGSKVGEAALDLVKNVVSSFSPDIEVEITLLQVLTSMKHYVMAGTAGAPIPYTSGELDQIKNAISEYLQEAGKKLMVRPGITIIPRVVTGKAADQILKTAEEINANVIAMSTHGRSGISRLALGSIAERVVHASSCPVLVVRSR